ncbi:MULTISPECIES: hypothetical protein [unclassified Halomonas]|uniref:hypothetical protein n=1 Tax=unclassified Halomonas TaxID=2609666 RepID=UPI001EF503DD|nr:MULTISPECIES: hypothetical protein [unclassified Halomonas]MCG7589715.1 hypothetical protein [Halomonas sp. McD50-5]MCG7616236.1 hypothetical protein [Halomonas sp. McD50-4]
MSKELLADLEAIAEFLQGVRIDSATEKQAQADLEQALSDAGWNFSREHRLSGSDIPDFLVQSNQSSIVIELKTRAQRKRIYRQLERYAQHDQVHALVLMTGTAMQLPSEINGKPACVASLGAGWL